MNELQRNNFQTQADALAAPSMNAQELLLVLWRRLWLIALIMAVCIMTAAALSKRTPKAWQANAQVLLIQRAPIMAASPQSVSSAPMVESIDTQVTLLQSRALAQQAAKTVGISTEQMQGSSTITPRKEGDNVIDLTVEADSRQHAVDWANALCMTFVNYKKTVSQNNSTETLKTLQVQAAQAKKQMGDVDAKLLTFQQTHHLGGIGVLDPAAQKTAALNAFLAQDAVVANFKNEYATEQAKAASLKESLGNADRAIKNSKGVRDDDEVVKLQEHLHDLQRQREETVARGYKPKFPGKFSALDAQIADTARRLQQSIQGTLDNNPSLQAQNALAEAYQHAQADADAAQVKLTGAIQQRDHLQAETTGLPQISMEADKLMESADQAHKLYNSLSAAVQAAQLDKDVASGNVQIVQPAFAPEEPFRPNHKRDLMVGIGVGLCLSLLAVFLLEQADRSVRTVADVRRLAEGPVVAALPQMTRAQRGQLASGDTPPHLVETYNAARANLALAMRQRTGLVLDDHQVILVSSAIPGEGKSLTASELAQSFARAGRRVVLVNADMRRPSSLPLLRTGTPEKPGLAELLAGEASLEEALSQTETPNLSIVHGGRATRNPMDLISKPTMTETIQALRVSADVVIIDSPPAAVVADALLLAPLVDCVLYVVGAGMVGTEIVRNTAAALALASPKMLAYFVNRIPHIIGEPASYSYAGYGPSAFTQADSPRNYENSRTVVLERYHLPEQGSVTGVVSPTDVSGAAPSGRDSNGRPGGSEGNTGERMPLRVLPEIGSRLTTLEGPYLGQSFALSANKPLTLGTLPDSDIVLARDETISQNHLHITPEDGRHVVYNDSSTNGTFVNDALISKHALEVGDVLQIGVSKFRYE